MPQIKVTHPATGKTLTIQGDTVPSEQELDEIFAQTGNGVPQPPQGKSIGGFAGNLLNSGANFVGDTLSGMASLAGGGIDLLTGEKSLGDTLGVIPDVAQAMGQHYKDRFFSGKFLDNLYQDPVGMIADVSTIASPGRALTKVPGMAKVGKAAGTVAKYTDPLSAISIPKRPKKAESLMTQSMGTQGKALLRKDPQAAKKALDYGVGIDKVDQNQARIDALMDAMDNRIGEMSQTGRTVDAARVMGSKPVADVMQEAKTQMVSSADEASVANSLNDFYMNKGSQLQSRQMGVGKPTRQVRVPRDIPIPEARELVKGTYKQIPKDYMKQTSDVKFSAKTSMALASGMVDELRGIEDDLVQQGIIPASSQSLSKLGKESQERIRLQQVFEEALLSEATSRGKGFASWLASFGIGGAAGAGNMGAAAGIGSVALLRELMKDRKVQAKIARAYHTGKRLTPKSLTPLTRTADITDRFNRDTDIPEPPK
jgi:hypothetical protein